MSRLEFWFPTITLIVPTCWGVRGVLLCPAMMVLGCLDGLVKSRGHFFIGPQIPALRPSHQNAADQGR